MGVRCRTDLSFTVGTTATSRFFRCFGLRVAAFWLLADLLDFLEQSLHRVEFIATRGLDLSLMIAALFLSGLFSSLGSGSSLSCGSFLGSFCLFLHLLNFPLPFSLLSPQALLFLLSSLSFSNRLLSCKQFSPSEGRLLLSLPGQCLSSEQGSLTSSQSSLSSQLEGTSSGCGCLPSAHQLLLALHLSGLFLGSDLTLLFGCGGLASSFCSPSGSGSSSSSGGSSPSPGLGSSPPGQGQSSTPSCHSCSSDSSQVSRASHLGSSSSS